jgi:hypothetical protein
MTYYWMEWWIVLFFSSFFFLNACLQRRAPWQNCNIYNVTYVTTTGI